MTDFHRTQKFGNGDGARVSQLLHPPTQQLWECGRRRLQLHLGDLVYVFRENCVDKQKSSVDLFLTVKGILLT